MSQPYTSSTAVTVRLAADGKNWKDWIKQIVNYASADSAFAILDGSRCPSYDASSPKYNIEPLFKPTYDRNATPDMIEAEVTRIAKLNKALRVLNDDAR